MKIVSMFLLSAGLSSAAQVIQGGSGSKEGVGFRYETRVEPRIEGQKVIGFSGGGIQVGDKEFHRFLEDDATRRYVGYDVTLAKQADGTLVIVLGKLSLSAEKLGLSGEWTLVPLRVNSNPRIIRLSDEVVVDMFTNPATGQKIVDHLYFGESPIAIRSPEGAPRDFTVDDVPLTLMNPKISLNGKLLDAASAHSTVSGEEVVFYFPGHGRYTMSLVPNLESGCRKLGEIRGSTISFRDGIKAWSIDCAGPVAPGGGVFNLYVCPDHAWRPSPGADTFQFGADDRRR